MKKTLTSFAVFTIFALFSFHSLWASHFVGADLTYVNTSGNTYLITLNLYRDCAGAAFGNTATIAINSASCGFSTSVTATQVGPATNVSGICAAQLGNTTCNGGTLPGIQQYVYQATYTLPQQCVDWKFSFSDCCRNYAISTGAGGNSFYVESMLNNVAFSGNNSPTFSSLPVPYFCAGQLANYNHGAIDIDGDSLVYQMVMPQQSATGNVTLNAPYTATYPIATTPANSFGFNGLTGQMTFTPAAVQQGVTAVRVYEYRNGILIGYATRDIQIVMINCVNNSNVQIGPVSNLTGAVLAGTNNIRVCAGNSVSFTITAQDPNAGTILTMTSNNATAIPGSTFTTVGSNPKTGTFTWATNSNSVGYWNFTITITDNNCPVPSVQIIGFTINVFGVDIAASDYTFCPGIPQNVQLDASVGGTIGCPAGNCYSWSPATGLSATNIPNPIATVSQPITYTVTYNDGVCTVTDQVAFIPEGSVTISPANPIICAGGNVQLTTANTFPNNTGSCGPNNSPCNGPVAARNVGTALNLNNTAFTSVTPYNGYWHDSRMQMLVLESELTAAGVVPGLLRSLTLNIGAKNSNQAYQNFAIKMACTNVTSLGGMQNPVFTTVYAGTVSTTLGLNTYNFPTPYQWDGVSNLLIDICYDNTSYYRSDPVYYTPTTFTSVAYNYADNSSGCSMGSSLLSTNRPNLRMNNCPIAPPISYTWTSIAGAPVSSLSATNIPDPVASPNITTTYVVAANNGSCTVYDTVTVAMSPSVFLNDVIDVNSCPGVAVTLTASGSGITGYSWNTGVLTPALTVSPMTTTTYFVTATSSCGPLVDTVTIIINDIVPPTINNCPANITQANDIGVCGAGITWTAPTVTDNCPSASISQTSGLAAGSVFPIGTSSITYTATDVAGNTSACTFSITITDTESPVISNCPTNITLNNDPGQCGAIATWTDPTATDNCSMTLSQTQGLVSGSLFPLGATTVSYTAIDPAGNTAICSFTVTVVDNESPTIGNCPLVNITQVSDAGICGAVVNWAALTVSDNCPNPTLTQTQGLASGSLFPVGTNTITYTATDANGNTNTCTFTVTVTDPEAPTAICQNITVYLDGTGNISIIPSQVDNGSTDNCGIDTMTVTPNTFNCANIGVNNVSLSIADTYGNVATCMASVTVLDTLPPTPICQNVTLQLDNTGLATLTAAQVNNGSTDNCAVQSIAIDIDTFTCANIGANTVVLTVTDMSGNTASCNATITIEELIAPTALCQNLAIVLDATGNASILASQIDNGSTDNCGIDTITVSPSTFTCSNLGANNVTLTVTDVNGNTSTCVGVVTVSDTLPPSLIGCPANISQINDIGSCGAIITWTAPTYTDNCTAVISSSANPGTFFPLGTTWVTYTATDIGGNTDTCGFAITITDAESPVLQNCPANISVNANANCEAVANWIAPTVLDNCPGASVSSPISSGTTFSLGTTTVTYTATDAAGNLDSCSFTVTVVDNTPPTINNCPTNITQFAGVNCDAVVNWVIPTVSDNCLGASLTSTHNAGDTFPFGTTTVTYTATDAAGNQSTCSFNVTLNDNISPTINNCPTDIVLNLEARCDTVVSWTPPTATDNCTGATLISNIASGSVFTLGTTMVTYTATDNAGNTSSCSFNVTVNPPPAINANISQQIHPPCTGLQGGAQVSATGGSGSYTYTWNSTPIQYGDSASLPAGNFTVTVRDLLAGACVTPVSVNVSMVAPIVLTASTTKTNLNCFEDNSGTAGIIVNGGTIPYSYTWNNNPVPNSPTLSSLAAGTYNITATDAQGCSISKVITLTQPDSLRGIASQIDVKCFGNATGLAKLVVTGGTPPYNYAWTGTAAVSNTAVSLAAGSYSVTVTDAKGCSITRNFTIAQPAAPLSATFTHQDVKCNGENSGSATVTPNGGTAPYTYTWATTPIQYTASAQNLSAKNYTVKVVDANGCWVSETVSISEPPKLRIQNTDIVHAYCNEANGSASISPIGGTTPYNIIWNSTPVQTGANLVNVVGGDYTVTLTDANGCEVVKNITIQNTPPAQASFTSTPPNTQEILLSAATVQFDNTTIGGESYMWSFGDGKSSTAENPTHTFQAAGSYTVILTANNSYGNACPSTYELTYTIIPIGDVYFPNAFTPNGDGNNDYFFVGGEGISSFQGTIYDRWGKVIKEMQSFTDKWDGTDASGIDVPEGTYVYQVKVGMNDGRIFERTGTVIILR